MSAGAVYTVSAHGGRYRFGEVLCRLRKFEEAKEVADRAALEPGVRVEVEGFSPGGSVLVVHDWAQSRELVGTVSRGPLRSFWIVCKPSPVSVLADVLVETSIVKLARMFRGGLDPETVLMFADYADAHSEALRLLAARGKDSR